MGWYATVNIKVIFNYDIKLKYSKYNDSNEFYYKLYYYDREIKKYCYTITYTMKYGGASEIQNKIQKILNKFKLDSIKSIKTSYEDGEDESGYFCNIEMDNETEFNILQLVKDKKLKWHIHEIKDKMISEILKKNNLYDDVINLCIEFCHYKDDFSNYMTNCY